MYDKNMPYAARRSGDELLRKMCGGGNRSAGCGCNGAQPVLNRPMPTPPETQLPCAGMPSLAMVYAPKQAFEGVLPPAEALREGSLFCGLIKPFCGRSVVRNGR